MRVPHRAPTARAATGTDTRKTGGRIMGQRKRIGVMVPSTNTTCEADFQMVVPPGVTVHGQRLWLTNDALGPEGMDRMNGEIESGARYLATARVDAISYGCTTGSFFKGPGWDREMIALIEQIGRASCRGRGSSAEVEG